MTEYLSLDEIRALPVGSRCRDFSTDIWTKNEDETWSWTHYNSEEPRVAASGEYSNWTTDYFFTNYLGEITLVDQPDPEPEPESDPLHWGYYSQAVRIAKMLSADLESNSGTPFENMAYVTRVEMAVEGTDDTFMVIEWSDDSADYTINYIGG